LPQSIKGASKRENFENPLVGDLGVKEGNLTFTPGIYSLYHLKKMIYFCNWILKNKKAMLTLNLDNQTEKQFNKLLNYSGMDFSKLISSMINYRIDELNKGMRNIELDFINYENKYKIKTKDFYKRYVNGDFGNESESNDFMIWSGEYEAYSDFQDELDKLR